MKNYKNYYLIKASPEEVYQALTNPLTISLWTGEEAVMSTEPGSEFSLWGDSIVGRNIEFIANKKIVQQWYFGDQPEESIVTLILHPDKKGTSLELRHTNIPEADSEDIIEGWNTDYLGSLQDFYED
jgi:activator of HSP90 ATPase